MKLKEIIAGLKILEIYGDIDREISAVTYNSKNAGSNSLFVAIKGFKRDGHEYVHEALKNGACAVVVQKRINTPSPCAQIIVPDSREALARISSNFYLKPSSVLTLTGITGTNGKTTTAFLVDSILKSAGKKTSLITTIESFICGKKVSFDRTTPESLDLNYFFSESLKAGAEFATMEVSSHALDLHRVDFLDFNCLVFTNLTQDHLDYHLNMKNYSNTKKKLFISRYRDIFGGRSAVINADDDFGQELLRETDLKTLSYSINCKSADIHASNVMSNTSGSEMDVMIKNYGKLKIKSHLTGYFNIYNILASVGAGIFAGIEPEFIKKGIQEMNSVNGRFEKISEIYDFTVIVDYAHTPDGLENVLKTAKSILGENSRLITVFGCGGDRDKTKRSIMGKIAGTLSDFAIITSDNPRSEEPMSIIEMIEKGLKESGNKNYKKIISRKQAIIQALNTASKGDIVVIAGKGHEDYQEFANSRIYFSDQQVVRDWQSGRK